MPEREQCCETCRFWDQLDVTDDDGSGYGFCRRHAPRPGTSVEGASFIHDIVWPLTMTNDFCGEWQPLPDPPVNVPAAAAAA